jgi:hypothetical protein
MAETTAGLWALAAALSTSRKADEPCFETNGADIFLRACPPQLGQFALSGTDENE